MAEAARTPPTGGGDRTPPTKDDIAVQHRPDNAQSAHSSLRPTGADRHARGMRADAGPEPDPAEAQIAAEGRVGGVGEALRRRLGVEAIPPGTPADIEAKIRRIEQLADWLDTKFVIPVINWPIGLDGIIGLIPGVGDTVTTGLSGYLMYEAHNAGARKSTLAKMGWNVAVDWVLGTIPLVGDVFDIAHKANAKNARLLLEELRRNQTDMKLRAAERGTGT